MSYHRLEYQAPAPPTCRGGVVAIGNFDGVHRGHATLVARLRARADELGVPAVVLTFDPHPLAILRPAQFMPQLTTAEERSRFLHVAGADHIVVLNTSREMLQLSAEEFYQHVLYNNLQAKGFVEGPNFGFGRNRDGDVETLKRFASTQGSFVEVVEPFHLDGDIVSSNRIRRALTAGDVASARQWLGRRYAVTGNVGVGQKRGRQLGFPTANLEHISTLVPGDGVYAVLAPVPGAANIGPNPTFGEQSRKVEVHLIGFQGDLYGQSMTVQFVERLRETRKFESVEQLREQLQQDVVEAGNLAKQG